MTYNNTPSEDMASGTLSNSPAEKLYQQPISQEDIAAFISALKNNTIRDNTEYQVLIKALEKLSVNQSVLQTEIVSLKKMIDLQNTEIKELKQQDNTRWIKQYLDKPIILGFAVLLGLAIIIPLALVHIFVPTKLDDKTLKELHFLYRQETNRLPKNKKSSQ